MAATNQFMDILTAPGNFVLEGNRDSISYLKEHVSDFVETKQDDEVGKVSIWVLQDLQFGKGPCVKVFPTGHMAFYGIHGQRILGAGPDCTVLHECEWKKTEDDKTIMTRARVQLDYQQWGGIISLDTNQVTELKLPSSEGGKEPTPDNLRKMGAKAWGIPMDDMLYFYPDEHFTRNEKGHVLISNKKDGVYILGDGTFNQAIFVSYMGPIPWARIDLLNVVELYQSTLLGTGGAAFDMIWGLCDDQRITQGLIPLRYRGLPTFPIKQAYGLFCAYYRPEVSGTEDPYEVFMDTQRGFEIEWWLRYDPPWRFFDRENGICVTVQDQKVQKVTVTDDPAAIPYYNYGMKKLAPCNRSVTVVGNTIKLHDGDRITEFPLNQKYGTIIETPKEDLSPGYPFDWRKFFRGNQPNIDPVAAWTTSLRFTDDDTEVEEGPTQLFVLDQAYDYLNQVHDLPSRMERTGNVLIHNFDPVCCGFVNPDNRQRWYTILYNQPVWAQKNAQFIWDQAAREDNLKIVENVLFLSEQTDMASTYEQRFELVYRWIPFDKYSDAEACQAIVKEVAGVTLTDGLAFVVGPPDLPTWLASQNFTVICSGGVKDMRGMPGMLEHLRIHPKTTVNPKLTVVLGEKRGE